MRVAYTTADAGKGKEGGGEGEREREDQEVYLTLRFGIDLVKTRGRGWRDKSGGQPLSLSLPLVLFASVLLSIHVKDDLPVSRRT
jgi:hypothetical protein